MIGVLFQKICEMSLLGSYAILIVLLARLFLKRCGRKYAYVLWAVVFFNLCIPVTLHAPVSMIPRQVVEYTEQSDVPMGGQKVQDTVHTISQEVQSEANIAQQERVEVNHVAENGAALEEENKTAVMTGAQNEFSNQGAVADGEKATEASEETTQTHFLYEDYIGYLDESYEWAGYTNFVEQDYDADGLSDRVYREFITRENGTFICNYRIELGNGECINIAEADTVGTPEIACFDMNGDGQNEILFRQTYEMSTDPRYGGAFTLFEKKGDAYEMVKLPFERDADGSNHVELFTEQEGQTYRFLIPSLDFMQAIYVLDYEFWSEYGDIYKQEGQNELVWYAEPTEMNGATGLKCYIHLFDKWSNYGIEVTVSYDDGAYVVAAVDFIDDVRFSMRDENGALKPEYAAYEEILRHPEDYLIDPHGLDMDWNGLAYAGAYDFDGGVKELVFGDRNGISIYTYADGVVSKIKELYMPEAWGGFNGLYFTQGQLLLVSGGSDRAAYVCWNGEQTGYYCDDEYPWAYIDEEKKPFNVFTGTFSVKWITENDKAIPQIRFRGGQDAVNTEDFFVK